MPEKTATAQKYQQMGQRQRANLPAAAQDSGGTKLASSLGAAVGNSMEAQAAWLGDGRLQAVQRRSVAAQIGRGHGNDHLQRVVRLKRDEDAGDEAQATRELPASPVGEGSRPVRSLYAGPLAIQRGPADSTGAADSSQPVHQTVKARTKTDLPSVTRAAHDLLENLLVVPNPSAHTEEVFRTVLLLKGHKEELESEFYRVSGGHHLVSVFEEVFSEKDAIRAKSYLEHGTLRLADKIYFAAAGAFTDEDTLWRLMPPARANLSQVEADFAADYDRDYPRNGRLPNGRVCRIAGMLDDELSGWELDKAKALLAFSELRPVDEIRIATNRAGTDETMLFAALEACDKKQVRTEFKGAYGEDLDDLLDSELSGDDRERADLILAGRYTAYEKIRMAIEGLGTDEQAIYGAISKADQSERNQLWTQFQDRSSDFYQLLAGDLDAEDLRRVEALLRAGKNDTALDKLRQTGALEGSDLVDEIKMSFGDRFELYRSSFNDHSSEFRQHVNDSTDSDELQELDTILNGSLEKRLYWAVAGIGTDEDYIFHVLKNFATEQTKADLADNPDLMDALESDLSTRDFNRVQDLLTPTGLDIEERVGATAERLERERSWITDLLSNASDALGDENRELQAALDRARADGQLSPEEQEEIEHFQKQTDSSLEVYITVRNEIEDTAATILSTAAAITIGILSAGALSAASAAMIATQLAKAALVSAIAKVIALKAAKGDRFDVFGADGAMAFGSGAVDGVMNVLGGAAASKLVGSLARTGTQVAKGTASTTFRTVGRELLEETVEGGLGGAASGVFETAANEDTWKHGFADGIGRVAMAGGTGFGTGAVTNVGIYGVKKGYTRLRSRVPGGEMEVSPAPLAKVEETGLPGRTPDQLGLEEPPPATFSEPETELEREWFGDLYEETIESGKPLPGPEMRARPDLEVPGASPEATLLEIHPDMPNIMIDSGIEDFDMSILLKELETTPHGAIIADRIRSGEMHLIMTEGVLIEGCAGAQLGQEVHVEWAGSAEETASSLIHEGAHFLDNPIPGQPEASLLSQEGLARASEYEYRTKAELPPYDPVEVAYRDAYDRVLVETGNEQAARLAAERAMLDGLSAEPGHYGVESPVQEAAGLQNYDTSLEVHETTPTSFMEPESELEHRLFGDLDESIQTEGSLPEGNANESYRRNPGKTAGITSRSKAPRRTPALRLRDLLPDATPEQARTLQALLRRFGLSPRSPAVRRYLRDHPGGPGGLIQELEDLSVSLKGYEPLPGFARKSPSRVLRQNYEVLTGEIIPPDYDAHHIVPASMRRGSIDPETGKRSSELAQEILERAGIEVNAGVNCVPLPKSSEIGSMTGSIRHRSIHTARYYDALLERLQKAESIRAVRDTLRDIAGEISEGAFPF